MEEILDPKVLAKLSNLYLVARTVVEGFIAGIHRSIYKGFSVEFFEHREYSPGDDLKYLDWKVFGRTDRLYLKTFREETNLRSYLLLDISNSMNYKSDTVSKLEYGTFLAASLSYLMLKQRDAVGLVTFDSEVRTFIKPSSSPLQLHHLVENLKNINSKERTSIGEVLHKIAGNIKRRSLIILISDLLDNPNEIINGLTHFIHKHHEVIVFQLLDPAELSFPFRGQYEFVDLETKEKVRADALSIKPAYKKLFQEFLDFYKKSCAERKIDYVRGVTETPLNQFLYQYLNRRAQYK